MSHKLLPQLPKGSPACLYKPQTQVWSRYEVTQYALAAYAAGAAAEQKRADALAATINAMREVVTTKVESKADFVARVRAILSECPDTRVLHAVSAEREVCAKLCDAADKSTHPADLAYAIRARGSST